MAKMMRLQWTQDLDIETLEARGHWVTMDELLEVVTFHLPRYENTVKMCKTSTGQVNCLDLRFATKFVAMYLFIKVKGSCPMTYQYLTTDMVGTAKKNGAFIYQKMFRKCSRLLASMDLILKFFDSDQHKHASAGWLHRFCQAIAKTPVCLCSGHKKWRPAQ